MFKKLYYPKRLSDKLKESPYDAPKPTPKPQNAFLWVEDQQFHIIETEYGFIRNVDGAGRIIGEMEMKPFKVLIRPSDANIDILVDLMFSKNQTFNGKIESWHGDGLNKKMRDVIIHNCHLESMSFTDQYYEDELEDAIELYLAPQYIEVNGVVWEGDFNPSRPIEINPPRVLSKESFEEEETQGQIGESYFEDAQGNRTQQPKVGKEVLLKVNTPKMRGKLIDIDLGNPELNFIYNDELITDNTLTNIKVQGAITSIPLKTIKKQ